MSRQSPGVTGEEPLQHAALRRGTVGRQRDQKHRQGMQQEEAQQHASDAAPRAAFVLPLGRLCRSFQPILPMSPVVCLQGAWDGAPTEVHQQGAKDGKTQGFGERQQQLLPKASREVPE